LQPDLPLISCEQEKVFFAETIFSLLLLITLVWLLNREFEVSYRLSFYISLLSARDRRKIQNMKNQADWLVHNIIPNHVSNRLRKATSLPQEYSENHREVGIVFASLVNFNELYDESYMGGKEYLRVLNELISDFDEVLDRLEYRNVEKIKTIGSTFMAASGINNYIRDENTHPFQHLREMLEFVLELQKSVNEFNQSLIEFDLILRIGFNSGDITAGVIGTTKLYYDIWGDAVNIASRMESTGVEGKIQVSKKTMEVLAEWYDFEKRGVIPVKGKDDMTVYLFTGSKAAMPVTPASTVASTS
jgi:adenylate cyclase 9